MRPPDAPDVPAPDLTALNAEIVSCARCPRLAEYLARCRREHPDYWSRPVPGFGDPAARILILGLAPGYRGANRHGRVFTGDDSGRWVWSALHELGLASHPVCLRAEDPIAVRGVYISNAVRCVPPANRPSAAELTACRPFLRRELELLPGLRVVLALGRVAHATYLKLRGLREAELPFRHGATYRLPEPPLFLLDSYHPSRQNTNTGVLTRPMWLAVLHRAMALAGYARAEEREGPDLGTR